MQNKLIGNAVVGQSGGPTAAINATLAGVVRGVLENENHNGAITGIYGMRNGIEGFLKEDFVRLDEIFSDNEKLKLLETTPAAALGSCRKKLPKVEDDRGFYESVFSIFKKYNIRYFFYIGGNDSMDTVAKLSAYSESSGYEIRIIGVPKTIDNDLVGTDHTPGFGSAAKFIATVTGEIIRDCAVYTTKAVTIVEIMGRDAGWLAASSALGRVTGGAAPDYVYLCEKVFNAESFFADIENAFTKHPNIVIAVSEGIKFAGGRYVGEGAGGISDAFGHTQLGGTGKVLEYMVKEKFGCKVRSVELNLPQRCAGHLLSLTDITESVNIGRAAVKYAAEGISCEMVVFERADENKYKINISHKNVSEIANKVKRVPSEFVTARNNNVTDGCLEYLLPLIAGECEIKFNKGLPVHIVL